MSDENTSAVYTIIAPDPWQPGLNSVSFGLLLSPVGFFWGAITGTLSNQADLQLALDAKADLVHTHVEADITDLQNYTVVGHLHVEADITDLQNYSLVGHTHVEADILDLQAYLLDAAGSIANDGLLYARFNNSWAPFSTASGNVGEIVAWPHEDVPDLFLDCNGQSVNAVTFSKLFAIIGFTYGGGGANFNLPDLRGQFMRGTANGSGQDPDRLSRTDRGDGATGDLVGTRQDHEFDSHTHKLPIYANNNAGPQAENADTSGGLHDADSFAAGGSETRPRNVNMNFIIRYEGGGSGNLPPEIVVQDDGVTLTQAVQGFNFIGFNITEPVDDQIEISFGASPNNATFCPNYAFTFVSDTSWRITGIDATNLFSVGRRLRFVDGANNYFGTIISSSNAGGNTTMVMSMEAGDVLTVTVTEVCLVNGGVAWQPISQDPFGGNAITGIETGSIGATQYWVICGDGGRVAFSTDAGLTWTIATTGTVENLNDVAYSRDDESFLVVGDAAVLLHSTDGETFALDVTSLKALPEYNAGDAKVYSCMYDRGGQGYRVQWELLTAGAQIGNAYTQDDTATWDSTPNLGTEVNVASSKIGAIISGLADTDLGMFYQQNIDLWQFSVIPDESGATFVNVSSQAGVTGAYTFIDVGGSVVRCFVGRADGEIFHNTTLQDDITFGSSAVNAFVESPSLERIVAVGNDGKIATVERADYILSDTFSLRQNGSNPLANFTDVQWNEVDGMFIAVNDQGQILRSTNGLDTVVAPTFTGFTLIAADPFSGTRINRIMSGTIGADVFWVAIGTGGQLFTSIDAGITWTVRTTGTVRNLHCIGYNADDQQFFVGCASGDFLTSLNGTTWVLDNTTINGISAGGGDDFVGVAWEDTASLWWCAIDTPVASGKASWTTDVNVTTFTFRDGNIIANNGADTMARKNLVGNQVAWPENTQQCDYHFGAADTTDSIFMSAPNLNLVTCLAMGPGNGGFDNNNVFGRQTGGITRGRSDNLGVTNVSDDSAVLSGRCGGCAYSSISARWCMVGDMGQIFTLAQAVFEGGKWVETISPFTGNIQDVWYDVTDDIFIAVGSNGEIGRSVDGIS
jgi:microcystin-dependent protein